MLEDAMPDRVSSTHPLRSLFNSLVERTFSLSLGGYDPSVADYLADLLTDFIHMDQIYRLKDARGRRLEEVAEMLMEGDVRLSARSFIREREVHKHIGDFTLFWTGIYPEMLRYFRSAVRKDSLIDYVEQGKNSYYIASTFDHGEFRQEAKVLRRMSQEFDFCIFALSRVRQEMDRLHRPELDAARQAMTD
jgi:hypothetical protein